MSEVATVPKSSTPPDGPRCPQISAWLAVRQNIVKSPMESKSFRPLESAAPDLAASSKISRTQELSSFTLGLRSGLNVSADEFEAFLLLPKFRLFIDAMPDPVIVTDAADIVVVVNQAADWKEHRPESFKSVPLTTYARQCDLDMDDFLAALGRGHSQGVVRVKTTGKVYFAGRRVLLTDQGVSGHFLYLLRSADVAEQGKRSASSRAGSRSPSEVLDNLLFPPELSKWVERAKTAYLRNIRVLLLGESGVGKTEVAKHLHNIAGERARPFVHVNCGSIPESLFESEMFGYERGAFTGALQSGKRGYIESAAGGTLFLDEIGEIPISSQAKLLKFLEDGSIQPVGSAVSKKVEARVIGATNRDLHQMMAAGTFRKDLYFRISTFPLNIPPLREREDRGAILEQFLKRVGKLRGAPLELSSECRTAILSHEFPGNLREMRSLVEFLSVVSGETAERSDLPESILSHRACATKTSMPIADFVRSDGTLKDITKAFEDVVIRESIQKYGSKREAARRLGVDIATLVRKTTRKGS